MPSGLLQGRATMCGRCGTYLSVLRGARSVRCALCHAVTRVQRRPSGLEDFLRGLIYNLMSPPEPPPEPSSSEDRLPAIYPRMPGRKRALLVGISYISTKYELKGTMNDVNCMSYILHERFGFPKDNIIILTDKENNDPNCVPTMKNIRLAMRWLVQGCNTGDAMSLVFHFSGRGVNEALCPLHFDQDGVIQDYEINQTIVRQLGPGVKLHAFVDIDHSDAVVLDLPYVCRISRNGRSQWENQSHQSEMPKNTSGGLAIAIGGCRDSQITTAYTGSALAIWLSRHHLRSLDQGTGPSTSIGATTYTLIKALESEPGTTYGRLIQAIRAEMSQEPHLHASETFDIYRKPFLL